LRKVICTNFDLCTGCAICQLICSEMRSGGTNPRLALLKIANQGLVHRPVVCAQCQNAFCLKVCPNEAIYRNKHNGAVIIDQEKCNGCGLCAEACPIDMILLDKQKNTARKCDLCGGEPLCVKYCPTGALELVVIPGGENNE